MELVYPLRQALEGTARQNGGIRHATSAEGEIVIVPVPIVSLDGIVVPIQGESDQVSEHTMYVAIGINLDGKKQLLGLWLNKTEGAKFWLSCLTDFKNRGLYDIFIICVDGLTGFSEAIQTAYPQAKVQLCIVRLVRAAL